MEKAFSKFDFMGLKLRNRFIRSATMEVMASPDDGAPTEALKELYLRLAVGGVGLISTSACLSDRSWVPDPRGQLSLHSDAALPAWEEMIEAVHREGALISVQLGPFFYLNGRPVGPSAYRPGVHALSSGEIEQLVLAFGAAAKRARKVGADAVQVHAGHGYPVSQFLSPLYNQREDEYGGSPSNRARLLVEIRRAMADSAGRDFPVWIKMNSFDGQPGGITPEDADAYGPILSEAGYGAVEVTGGSPRGSHDSRGPLNKEEWFEGYYLKNAARMKKHTDLPVVAVGGIRRPEMVDRILSDEMADLIAMSRPFIREPGLIQRWMSGDLSPAACISCNGCFKVMRQGKGLYCVQEKGESNK